MPTKCRRGGKFRQRIAYSSDFISSYETRGWQKRELPFAVCEVFARFLLDSEDKVVTAGRRRLGRAHSSFTFFNSSGYLVTFCRSSQVSEYASQ